MRSSFKEGGQSCFEKGIRIGVSWKKQVEEKVMVCFSMKDASC